MSYLFDYLDSIKGLLRRSPFGLITDVDGTISETAPTPQEAKVHSLCQRYLSELCRHLPLVAAISGRSVAQVRDMVGIDGMVYVGNHGLEVWVEGDAHTNTIEGFWSLLKRGINGVYHSVSEKYLQNYINEYAFRYNHRKDTTPMFKTILGQISKA